MLPIINAAKREKIAIIAIAIIRKRIQIANIIYRKNNMIPFTTASIAARTAPPNPLSTRKPIRTINKMGGRNTRAMTIRIVTKMNKISSLSCCQNCAHVRGIDPCAEFCIMDPSTRISLSTSGAMLTSIAFTTVYK
ncbi:MAG: hypothetical protein ACTSYS_05715 [Promethearchaeota archaeon]